MDAPGAHILSIGTALPRHAGTQAKAQHFFSEVVRARAPERERDKLLRYLELLTSRSGISTRHTVLADYLAEDPSQFEFFPHNWRLEPLPGTGRRMKVYETESATLARRAAESALSDAGVRASEITDLVVTSCTGFFAPGLDISLVEALSLSPRVARTMIGFMGCQAGFNAMRIADQIIRARPESVVLQVSVELCTLHLSAEPTPEALVANTLFGDGAAAVVYGSGEPQRGLARLVRQASRLELSARDQMSWKIGDHGFSMFLDGRVPRSLESAARSAVGELIESAGDERVAVRRFAVHPGGPRILDAVERALGLPPSVLASSRGVLRDHGNMSSAAVFFVLQRELLGRRPAAPLVALGFGPGLSIEAALFEVF